MFAELIPHGTFPLPVEETVLEVIAYACKIAQPAGVGGCCPKGHFSGARSPKKRSTYSLKFCAKRQEIVKCDLTQGKLREDGSSRSWSPVVMTCLPNWVR